MTQSNDFWMDGRNEMSQNKNTLVPRATYLSSSKTRFCIRVCMCQAKFGDFLTRQRPT